VTHKQANSRANVAWECAIVKKYQTKQRMYEKMMENKRKKIMENLIKAGWKGK